jgi:hypothetical protein
MTKYLLKYALLSLGLAVGTCTSAYAFAFRHPAPEVDPSIAVSGLVLIAGSIAVMRVRHKR